DCSRKVTVDREIIPFEYITNHACGDYPVLRRIHARSPVIYVTIGMWVRSDAAWSRRTEAMQSRPGRSPVIDRPPDPPEPLWRGGGRIPPTLRAGICTRSPGVRS